MSVINDCVVYRHNGENQKMTVSNFKRRWTRIKRAASRFAGRATCASNIKVRCHAGRNVTSTLNVRVKGLV